MLIMLASAEFLMDRTFYSSAVTETNREYFPDMEKARKSPGVVRTAAAAWSAVAAQAARLVPASTKATLTARANSRALRREIKRVQELSPHLMADIGVEELAHGGYRLADMANQVTELQAPAATAPAASAAKSAPQRARRASEGWAPFSLPGLIVPQT